MNHPSLSGAMLLKTKLVAFQNLGERKEITSMPQKSPWHSVKESVHHNNTNCNTGNNIEKENLREGTGGKPLCQECAKLNQQGK